MGRAAAQEPMNAAYDALLQVMRERKTSRAFDPNFVVPREHYDLIL